MRAGGHGSRGSSPQRARSQSAGGEPPGLAARARVAPCRPLARRTGARQHRRARRALAPAGRVSCDLVYPATSSAAAIDEGTLTTMKTIDANRGPAFDFNVDRSILANHRHGVPYTL